MIAGLRKKLRRRIAARDRQRKLHQQTGKQGHREAAQRHTTAIKKLRSLIRKRRQVRPISDKGVRFIAEFEGFFPKPYNDPVGYATVGYGHLLGYRAVRPSDHHSIWVKGQKRPGVLTKGEARQLLRQELARKYEPAVTRLFESGGPLHGKFDQAFYDALVSFAFNLGPASMVPGTPGFETLGRAIQSGKKGQIAGALTLYDKAGGKALPGLTRRRNAEKRLMISGLYHTR